VCLRHSDNMLIIVVFYCSVILMTATKSRQRFPSDDRELRDIWADAYAAWDFGNYLPNGRVQYIRPLPAGESKVSKLGSLTLPYPVIFEITAFNPAALSKSLPSNETNFKRLRQLRDRISQLSSPKPAMVAHSFGFDKTWREDGCMVAYADETDREKARADLIRLGVEFGQGAVYEIQRLPEDEPETVATRTTVPCSEEFEETTAIVKITGTEAPVEFPDLIWEPTKYYHAEEFKVMLTTPTDGVIGKSEDL
ncbi:hypothetical protein FOZ62_028263, partial [Perkinsus olseni]